jgi:hypothetical protein
MLHDRSTWLNDELGSLLPGFFYGRAGIKGAGKLVAVGST